MFKLCLCLVAVVVHSSLAQSSTNYPPTSGWWTTPGWWWTTPGWGTTGFPGSTGWWSTDTAGSNWPLSTFYPSAPVTGSGQPWTGTPSGSCSGVIYIQEMTTQVSSSQKLGFFNVASSLSASINAATSALHAFAQYGSRVYLPIGLADYQTFSNNLQAAQSNFVNNGLPNGDIPRMEQILSDLLDVVRTHPGQRFAVLLAAESQYIRDPTTTHSLCQQLASRNTDFYVIDYGSSAVTLNLWKACTGNADGHIIDGTSSNADQLIQTLTSSLVNDVLYSGC